MSQRKGKDGILSKWSIDDKPVKVDKWDGTAVKNALDDAVKKIMIEKYQYKESHFLMDGRLAICAFAVGVAMFALVWDYLYPFPQSRPVLIFCVVTYFIMMGVLTLYTTLKEKGIFLVALQKDAAGVDPDSVWYASSYLKRFDDIYHLVITYTDGTTKQTRKAQLDKSISCWFDENGQLLIELFEPDISKIHSTLTSEKKEK